MAIELFLMGTLGLCLFGFYLLRRRRHGVAGQQIPDHVVKAFLYEILSLSEGFKRQLFGLAPLEGSPGASASIAAAAARAAATGAVAHAGADNSALNAQLSSLTVKNDELSKLVSALTADKKALEEKLKAAPTAAAPAAGAGGDDSELKSKIANLEARLAEYEVIEDDLANLKRYQQENKQLKATIDMLKGGAGAATPAPAPEQQAAPAPTPPPEQAAPPPPAQQATPTEPAPPAATAAAESPLAAAAAPTPAPAESPLAAAEEARVSADAEGKLGELATKVDESIAAPATDGVADPARLAQAQTAPASSDATQEKPASPAGEQKSDSDLLSEFEKMLSG